MLKSKKFRAGLALFACISILTFSGGCGDTKKRATGKNLRKAAESARVAYEKAQKILSSPPPKESQAVPGNLDPDVLNILQAAEKQLAEAIQANYEADKNDPEKVSQIDAGAAKLTLGMLRHLKGQYFTWSIDLTLRRAKQIEQKIHQDIHKLHLQNTTVLTCRKSLALDRQKLKDDQAAARKAKDQADKKRKTLQQQIRERKDRITQLEKRIEANNLKASKLDTQHTLATGQESLLKLEESLEVKARIHEDHTRIQQINSELSRLQSESAANEIELKDAAGRLDALNNMARKRASDASANTEKLNVEMKKAGEICKVIGLSLGELDQCCTKTTDLTAKANSAYDSAHKAISAAGGLVSPDKKAHMLSEDSQVKASSAELQLTLRDFGAGLEKLSSRITTLWGELYEPKPPTPKRAAVEQFIKALKGSENTKAVEELAATEYKQAVDLQEQAVRAADSKMKWLFQMGLYSVYRNYAKVLEITENASQANDFRKKAEGLLGDIENGAKAAGKHQRYVRWSTLHQIGKTPDR